MTLRFRKAIVVGASSGIGEAVAKRLAASGTDVAIVARRSEELSRVAGASPDHLHPFVQDVRRLEDTPELFESALKRLGGLDILVYAAGVMPSIAEGEYSFEKDRAMIEVNLLGAMAWMNLAAAHFEAAGTGTIIGISSIAGERGRRGNPAYCTSKAALSTYLESLRNRCSRYGVNVVTVKPGFVDTAMTRGMRGLFWLVSADKAAEAIVRLAGRGGSCSCFVPRRWSLVAWVIRMLPSFVFRRLSV